jgi:mRNA interferase RelE/StbE
LSWTIRYSATAAKAISRLDEPIRRRVRAALDTLRDDPYRGKPLQLTLQGLRSWRSGDWRIIYRVDAEHIEILVVTIGHRREVYERVRDILPGRPRRAGGRGRR